MNNTKTPNKMSNSRRLLTETDSRRVYKYSGEINGFVVEIKETGARRLVDFNDKDEALNFSAAILIGKDFCQLNEAEQKHCIENPNLARKEN